MSFLEGAIFVGGLFGNLSSSWMYRHTSTTAVFAVAAVLMLLATLYVVFAVHESIQDNAADRRLGRWVRSPMQTSTLQFPIWQSHRRSNSGRFSMCRLCGTCSPLASVDVSTTSGR